MEDNKLDKLFFEDLSGEVHFNRREEQWNIVEARLDNNKRRWIWFLSSGIGVIALLGLLTLSNTGRNTTGNITVAPAKKKSEKNNQKKDFPITKEIIEATSEIKEDALAETPEERQPTKELAEQIEEIIVAKITPNAKTETPSDKEKCNCPEDEKNQIVNSDLVLSTAKKEIKKTIPRKVLAKENIENCSSIKTLIQSRLNASSTETRDLPDCGEYIIELKRKKWRPEITIIVGASKDFILGDNPIDTSNIYPLIGMNLRLTKSLSFDLIYSQPSYSIAHNSEFPDYSFLPDYNPVGTWVISKTNLNLRTRNLDLTLNYDLLPNSKLGVSPILGVRMSNTYKADFVVDYEDVYAVENTDFKLEPQRFAVNYWTTGLELSYKQAPFKLGLAFRTMIPRTESIYTFSDLYSIQASIHYRLK